MTELSSLSSVAELRRAIFGKGAAQRGDLTRALAWGGDKSDDYASLLADIAVDLLVDQADPPQYISAESAAWLIGEIQAHPLPYRVEMRLLSEVMDRAVSLPAALSSFALAEIESAVVTGRPDHPAGAIDAGDVEALRHAVYATDENASLHVTRPEAEALFRIAHAGVKGEVDSGFEALFAQAVGNHLMGIAFHGTPTVAEEKRLEDFENTPAPSFGGFLKGMFSGGLSLPTLDDLKSPDEMADARWEAQAEADIAERAQAERVDPDETGWLTAQLTRDGDLTSAERALLAFLKREEAGDPPEALRALFAKAGV